MNFSFFIIQWLIVIFLFNPYLGLPVIISGVVLGIGASMAIKKKLELFDYLIIFSGAALLSLLLSLKLYSLIMDQSLLTAIQHSIKEFFMSKANDFDSIFSIYNKFGVFDQPITAAWFSDTIISSVETMFPSAIICFSIIVGYLDLLIVRRLFKFKGIMVFRIPSFKEWAVPMSMSRGLFTIMLVALLGNWIGIKRFDMVFMTIYSILTFVFIIQGLAVGAFFLSVYRIPKFFRIIILGIVFIFIPLIASFTGIIEQFFRFRRLYQNRRGDMV